MKHWIIIFFLGLPVTQSAFAQYDTCSHLKQWEYSKPQNAQDARMIYDSLRQFIELCAAHDYYSYEVFSSIDGAVGLMTPNDDGRYDKYRTWLISVLFLNTTNPDYFCSCMGSIAGTYVNSKYNSTLCNLAVLKYIRQFHLECWSSAEDKEFSKDSIYAFQNGWGNIYPPLDSLDLGFLIHSNAVTHLSPLTQTYLASFTTSPNPFKTETTLSFTLNRMTYITVDVYDVLGHKVWGSDHGGTMDAGTHQVRIDGASISSGTYYARISTGFGEVKTVKLVKE